VDPRWTKQSILPNFSVSSPLSEASWNGLLFGGQVPQSAELFDLIKRDFLAVLDAHNNWLEGDHLEQQAAHFLVVATFWHRHDKRYLTNEECRNALRAIGESGRQAALWALSKITEGQEAWRSFGKKFLAEAWPQEARFQTGETSNTMIRIAENNPDQFPEIVSVISEYIRPVEYPDLFIYRQRRKEGDGERATLVQRWPLQVLELVDRAVPAEPHYPPHDLGVLLNEIAEHAPNARSLRSWRRLHELVSR
jgi:hypothetical protein